MCTPFRRLDERPVGRTDPPQVQAGGNVRRHGQAQRHHQGILDQIGLGIGKGFVPGIQILGDGLGLSTMLM